MRLAPRILESDAVPLYGTSISKPLAMCSISVCQLAFFPFTVVGGVGEMGQKGVYTNSSILSWYLQVKYQEGILIVLGTSLHAGVW